MTEETQDTDGTYVCRICGCTEPPESFYACDLKQGDTEAFRYDRCPHCHSVQIHQIPAAEILGKHYPESYYSRIALQHGRVKQLLRNARLRQTFGHISPLGWLVLHVVPHQDNTLPFIASCHIPQDAAVLDVGSGEAGNMLVDLATAGYSNLTGIEPFMSTNCVLVNGIKIHRAEVTDVHNSYDLITFIHSLEHTPDPQKALSIAREHLHDGGHCIIRIPMADSRLFALYGAHWINLEAPRHLSLMSRKGMHSLAAHAGFRIDRIEDDGAGASYAESIMAYEGEPYAPDKLSERFTAKQLAAFDQQARQDNLSERGDGTSFLLSAI